MCYLQLCSFFRLLWLFRDFFSSLQILRLYFSIFVKNAIWIFNFFLPPEFYRNFIKPVDHFGQSRHLKTINSSALLLIHCPLAPRLPFLKVVVGMSHSCFLLSWLLLAPGWRSTSSLTMLLPLPFFLVIILQSEN